MKNIFIGIVTSAILTLFSINNAWAFINNSNKSEKKDSVIIQFGNNSKILIYFSNKNDLEAMKSFDFNKMITDLSLSIENENNNEVLTIKDKTGKRYLKDTTIVLDKSSVFDEVENNFKIDGDYKEFNVGPFNKISAGNAFTFYIRQGANHEVKAKGKLSDLEIITAKVVNNKLIIGVSRNVRNMDKVEFMITAPSLDNLDLSGASTSFVKGFNEDKFYAEISGASTSDIDINAQKSIVKVSGASKVKMSGQGESLNVESSGASSFNGYNFTARNVTASSSGASKANVYAEDNLSASASGAGNISYRGNPSVTTYKSGAGSVSGSRGGSGSDARQNTTSSGNNASVARRKSTSHGFNVELGLNNYLQNGRFPEATGEPYSLNPLGSRYFGLSSMWNSHLGGPLRLDWGANLNWYNFRFDNPQVRAVNAPARVEFNEFVDANNAMRSKMTAVYLNGVMVPMWHFGSGTRRYKHWGGSSYRGSGFRIGLGGFAGYRIDSYSRFIFKENGEKRAEREKGNLGLNNFRYGTRLQMGFRGLDLFANYDLNNLFMPGRGPELNAFSFGIVF
jgi:hypothetical protein